MNEKKIIVPRGMYDAAMPYQDSASRCSAALQAALLWLSENPIKPTGEQFSKLYDDLDRIPDGVLTLRAVVEWQRRMFLAPEPHPAVRQIRNSLIACTFTREEADEIISHVNACVKP